MPVVNYNAMPDLFQRYRLAHEEVLATEGRKQKNEAARTVRAQVGLAFCYYLQERLCQRWPGQPIVYLDNGNIYQFFTKFPKDKLQMLLNFDFVVMVLRQCLHENDTVPE